MNEAVSRRRRLRAETEASIRVLAWEAIRESGAAALSLRDIARQLGMAPSALYRYFPSRSDLMAALVVEAFDSLGEQVQAEYARARATGSATLDVFMAVARTYRRWALAHRAEWVLIFSASLPGADRTAGTAEAAQRSFAVLQQLTVDAIADGLIDVTRLENSLDQQLRDGLQAWAQMTGQDVALGALAGAMWTYATMHGVISLDINALLPPPMRDSEAFFDSALRSMLDQIAPPGR